MSQQDVDVDELLRHLSPSKLDRSMTGMDHLTEIVASCGVLQKVRVRLGPDGYQILYGSRRTRAAKEAGLRTVPCAVTEVVDGGEIEVQLVPNMLREDSTLIDVGRAVFDLAKRLKVQNAASKLAVSPVWIYRHAAIAELPGPVLNAVEGGVVAAMDAIRELSTFYTESPAAAAQIISGRMGTLMNRRAVKSARKLLCGSSGSLAETDGEVVKQGPLAYIRREETVTKSLARTAKRELSLLAEHGSTYSRLSPPQINEIARRFIALMENPSLPELVRSQSLKELLRDTQIWAR